MDNYLSPRECDGLIRAHEKHVMDYSSENPLICFNDIETLRKHMREFGLVKLSKLLTENDFTPGKIRVVESKHVANHECV